MGTLTVFSIISNFQPPRLYGRTNPLIKLHNSCGIFRESLHICITHLKVKRNKNGRKKIRCQKIQGHSLGDKSLHFNSPTQLLTTQPPLLPKTNKLTDNPAYKKMKKLPGRK